VGIDALSHSQRIAAIGSIRAARSAGSSEATLAIKVSAATDPSNTQGSRGDVPYKSFPGPGQPKVLWSDQLRCRYSQPALLSLVKQVLQDLHHHDGQIIRLGFCSGKGGDGRSDIGDQGSSRLGLFATDHVL
jgi:hypothetical protein